VGVEEVECVVVAGVIGELTPPPPLQPVIAMMPARPNVMSEVRFIVHEDTG
jgi:hypothetical protein